MQEILITGAGSGFGEGTARIPLHMRDSDVRKAGNASMWTKIIRLATECSAICSTYPESNVA
jgi:hypothetical protein